MFSHSLLRKLPLGLAQIDSLQRVAGCRSRRQEVNVVQGDSNVKVQSAKMISTRAWRPLPKRYERRMNRPISLKTHLVFLAAALLVAACSERPTAQSTQVTPKPAREVAVSCALPPLAVNVGALLDPSWGKNGQDAFPFTKGGPEPAPGNVELRLSLRFKLSNGTPVLVSVTGHTPAGDNVYLPAIVNRPVAYAPPIGGYSESPAMYQAKGCDSIWSPGSSGPGALASQNPDGSYRAQCASFAMDSIPVVFSHASGTFSSSLSNPALSSFVDKGNTGWFDANTGKVMVGAQSYSLVSRGWEIAARLQEAGVAKFTAEQMPWENGVIGKVSSSLVSAQLTKFGATESTSGSDYTYRTDAYSQDGKWTHSHGHYSTGMPKSGPGRLSAGVAMFRLDGSISSDKKTLSVTNFSYAGPMLVCPVDGRECTASPGRGFTGLSCSASI